ncbi:hypothetical protein D3C81_903820 [compost metagenome]
MAQLRGLGLPVAGGLVDFAGQLGQALFGATQLFQLGFDTVAGAGELLHRYAVFACQVVQAAEAALDFLEGVRVAVQVVLYAVQLRQGFVQLNASGVEDAVDLTQAAVVLADTRQFLPHLLQQGEQGRGVVIAIEQAVGALAGFDQGGGMGLAAVAAGQVGDGGRLQLLALQLTLLVFKEADAVGDIALLGQRVALIQQGLPAGGGSAHGGALGLVAGEGVQQ